MAWRLKVGKNDETTPTVTLSRADRIAVIGIAVGAFVAFGGGSVAFLLAHDRDITTLKADAASLAKSHEIQLSGLRAELLEARADIKTILQQVARMEAKLERRAEIPAGSTAMRFTP